jgi:hypothetical protein
MIYADCWLLGIDEPAVHFGAVSDKPQPLLAKTI